MKMSEKILGTIILSFLLLIAMAVSFDMGMGIVRGSIFSDIGILVFVSLVFIEITFVFM